MTTGEADNTESLKTCFHSLMTCDHGLIALQLRKLLDRLSNLGNFCYLKYLLLFIHK